ncbi:ankyrin repeat-containing domain protein [Immersiella caudata]|uniref:Ankyrin repeat-containing domain protein n=1 Tax=Immersiella caudata TaxID=314043 RepID=A0AA40C0W9_9PEZI|nr:ankyrin repeat-containing domain protein [Immersiella caudata]
MEAVGAILAITEAVLRTSSKIWALSHEWKDAPAEFHQLKDELERTYQFFDDTREGLKTAWAAEQKGTSTSSDARKAATRKRFLLELGGLLDEGVAVIHEIEEFVDKIETPKVTGKVKALDSKEIGARRRLAWMTGSRSITQRRAKLKSVVTNICRLLLAQNIAASASIRASLAQSRDEITEHMDKSLQSYRDATAAELRAVLAVSHEAIIAHLNCQFRPRNEPVAEASTPSADTGAENEVHASLEVHGSGCSLDCGCHCHAATRYKWQITSLHILFGSFILEYKSQPARPCNTIHCHGPGYKPRRAIRAGYTLPPWLVWSSLAVMYSSHVNGSPEMLIRLANHLPWDTAHAKGLFGHVRDGDIDGLKEALRQRKASLHDRVFFTQQQDMSLLQYAIGQGRSNTPITRLLLQVDADPHDMYVRNEVLALLVRGDPEDIGLISDFPLSTYLEDAELSILHKVVMGIAHVPLAKALSLPQCMTHSVKHGENTAIPFPSPLQIAAMRDDAHACRLLVQAGVEIDNTSTSPSRSTPLHQACRSDNYRAAEALISLGASTTIRDFQGLCALCKATLADRARNGTRLFQLILDNGGDVNSTTHRGSTPLIILASYGSEHTTGIDQLNFLIDKGSDINRQDADGDTALTRTMFYNNIRFARVLLERGARSDLLDQQNRSILHYAALFANQVSMERLVELGGLIQANSEKDWDVNAADFEDKTPRQLFNERHPPPGPEMRAAFERFLRAVQGMPESENDGDDDEDEEADEFVDAREVQEK